MLATKAITQKSSNGRAKPRIAPPTPARSRLAEFKEIAEQLGYPLFPWQETLARYLTALGPEDRWLYPELAAIVARQNGKTTVLIPLIVSRLLAGQRIMHTAQNRELPREIHDQVATLLGTHFPKVLPSKRGIRYGAGQEEIRLTTGGKYRIVAPSRGGARGPSNDLVIIDELREMEDFGFIAAAKPTLTASANPQMVYLSNAGTKESVVLNALKKRATEDPALAYLEWSAGPERRVDELAGWLEANPSISHLPHMLSYIEGEYRTKKLEGTLALFETEHLCRWVITEQPHLVDDLTWSKAQAAMTFDPAVRPFMGVSMDASGTRASAALAWQQTDGKIALQVLMNEQADALDTDKLGKALKEHALRIGVPKVAHNESASELAKYIKAAKVLHGREFANASQQFVQAITSGRLQWTNANEIGEDLPWTTRRPFGADGAWIAVKADDDRPITAVEAAIRAVWLASGPKPAAPRVY